MLKQIIFPILFVSYMICKNMKKSSMMKTFRSSGKCFCSTDNYCLRDVSGFIGGGGGGGGTPFFFRPPTKFIKK